MAIHECQLFSLPMQLFSFKLLSNFYLHILCSHVELDFEYVGCGRVEGTDKISTLTFKLVSELKNYNILCS